MKNISFNPVYLVILVLFGLVVVVFFYFSFVNSTELFNSSIHTPAIDADSLKAGILPTRTSTPTYTSTPSSTPTNIPVGVTVPPTPSPTNTYTPTPTSTPTPLSTFKPTVNEADEFPSPTLTTTPTPSSVVGIAKSNLNVRRGPSTAYGYTGYAKPGEEVTILGRESEEDWLYVQTPRNREGWIFAELIELQAPVTISELPLIPTPQPPLPTTTVESSNPLSNYSTEGQLEPYTHHKYPLPTQEEPVFTLLFFPNVISNGTGDVLLELYNGNTIFGQGTGQNKDSIFGKLVWRGSSIEGNQFRLRIENRSSETIKYCLIRADVNGWECSSGP